MKPSGAARQMSKKLICPHGKTEGSLDWWLHDGQRRAWPRLLQMVIDILLILAMSDEPERVFSGAWRTISWERMKLGSTAI